MIRIGLTGGIASGKSTAAKILHDLGAETFDADRIVANLYSPGAAGAKAVERLFGRSLLEPDGAVSKPALAAIVFADPENRRKLEAEIHPLVIAEIRGRFEEARASGAEVAVAEASQIFEGGYEREFDRVLLVVAPRAARLARGEARGIPRGEVERRIAAQIAEEVARAKADDILENDGTVAELREKIVALYRTLTASPPSSDRP